MNNRRRMDVHHTKYGWGYVFLIAEDYLLVNFCSGSRIRFPITAIEDGTLQISGYTRAQFRRMQGERRAEAEVQDSKSPFLNSPHNNSFEKC